jgi:hypothetical protein
MVLRARRGPSLIASTLLVLVLLLARARPANAWVDVHVERDDIRLSIDPSGSARIEHRITLKIAGGPLRSLDLRGVDRDAAPEPEGYVVPLKEANQNSLASAVPVALDLMPPGNKSQADGSPPVSSLRIRFQNDRGLGRGVYVLMVRYRTNLSDQITVDGAMAKVAWRGPIWDDGLDSVRVTFELPTAPNEPRAEDATDRGDEASGADRGAEPGAPDRGLRDGKSLMLSTVRRGTTKDAIELLRPYTPKGEAVTWAIRADRRAFKATAPESARPPAPAPKLANAITEPERRAIAFAAAAGLFLLYSLLVAQKSLEVARDAEAAGAAARPLLPLPAALRAVLAGLALVAGLAVEFIAQRATLGALLVLLAAALATHRTPHWNQMARLRGPGRWLPIAEAEAFREPPRRPGGYLDVSTRAGKALFILALAALAAGAVTLYEISPYQAQLVTFDVTAILAIFCTGRRAELPPLPDAPARFLRNVARRARRAMPADEIRIVGRIRIPEGSSDADELRLSLAPRNALGGLLAIEVGVVYAMGAGGPLGLPEVLLRVTAGSACDEAIAALVQNGRCSLGRKPGEKVIAFSPRLPTARMTAGLAMRLLRAVAMRPAREDTRAAGTAGERRAA